MCFKPLDLADASREQEQDGIQVHYNIRRHDIRLYLHAKEA
jgi:hypothetical protein